MIRLAALGLGVNLISAWLLREDHDHDIALARNRRDHHHQHHQHADHNLRAAYLHVVADAAVSLMALLDYLRAGSLAGSGWTR